MDYTEGLKILGKYEEEERNWRSARQKMTELLEICRGAGDAIVDLDKKVNAKRAELAELEKTQQDATTSAKKHHAALLETQNVEKAGRLAAAKRETDAAESTVRATQARQKQTEIELNKVVDKHKAMQAEIAKAQEQLDKINSEIAAARTRLGL